VGGALRRFLSRKRLTQDRRVGVRRRSQLESPACRLLLNARRAAGAKSHATCYPGLKCCKGYAAVAGDVEWGDPCPRVSRNTCHASHATRHALTVCVLDLVQPTQGVLQAASVARHTSHVTRHKSHASSKRRTRHLPQLLFIHLDRRFDRDFESRSSSSISRRLRCRFFVGSERTNGRGRSWREFSWGWQGSRI
jgi:hypothetical protein